MTFPDPDDFATLGITKFENLSKSGKPSKSEWTVLSCIILHDSTINTSKVIALGTGTKCIGHSDMCPKGYILNDSHAEVIARRAFLRYIYFQLRKNCGKKVFSYDKNSNHFKLNSGITFHFFSTHPPCGDASIFSTSDENRHDDGDPPAEKKMKIRIDEVFTGAKLIDANISDSMDQEEGQVRTKPGRGNRTLSMSCSDKLARWNVLGIQGALLDSVLEEPLYIKTFNFCGSFNRSAFSRAIVDRWRQKDFKHNRFIPQHPEIRNCSSNIHFDYCQSDMKDPSPSSISWCDVEDKPLEVVVCGRKQGVTKKNLHTRSAAPLIAKAAILEEYLELLKLMPEIEKRLGLRAEPVKNYRRIKKLSKEYQEAWEELKISYFGKWTKKPNFLNDFKLENEYISS